MIRLTKPLMGSEEIAEVTAVLASGYLSRGPKIEQFENALRDYLNVRHAITVSSGTAALHLALLALGIGAGDQVIVPDFCFPAVANAVVLVGAQPVLCDIDLATFNLDPVQARRCINNRTKAMVIVHQFGLAAAMRPLLELAHQHELIVLEDAACALGAQWEGKKCGTSGHASCVSFHPRKTITTGEGGVVLTHDDQVADRVRSLRHHGAQKDDFRLVGFNYRMSDVNAALGVAQLKRLDHLIQKRRELAGLYAKNLYRVQEIFLPGDADGVNHTYQSYVIRLRDGLNRDLTIKVLGDHGIESVIGTYAIHQLDYYKRATGDLTCSATAYRQTLALPLYPEMSSSQIEYVCDVLVGHIQSVV